jgi:hypothetical protein
VVKRTDGGKTYDIWSGFWPKAPSSPMADRLNAATKFVATHRPESLEWGPFERLGPDVVEDVRRIKAQDGPDLVLSGSSTLTSTLLRRAGRCRRGRRNGSPDGITETDVRLPGRGCLGSVRPRQATIRRLHR